MSYYPVWWDTGVTVYNKYTDPLTGVVTWHRYVIDGGCFWQDRNEKIKIESAKLTITANGIICRIPENPNFRLKHIWVNIPNDEMGNYFTLSIGDIIVKGEVTDEIDEYTTGNRASDLLNKYKNLQGCMLIDELAINTGPGRGLPHYHARGV